MLLRLLFAIYHMQVDKTMFSDLTAEMKQNLETTLPKSAFSDKDDMIPVMADPKVNCSFEVFFFSSPFLLSYWHLFSCSY